MPANIVGYCFIECKVCGTVVGTVEASHIGELVAKLAKKLGYPSIR